MFMRCITLWFALSAAGLATAQQASRSYIVTFFGDTLSGGCLAYRTPISKTPYFELDTARFFAAEVRTFKNQHGVFFNTSSIHQKDGFALRIVNAPVSVLEAIDLKVYGKDVLPANLSRAAERRRLASGDMDYLANHAGQVVQANGRGIRSMVHSCPEAMLHVRRHRGYNWLRAALIASGTSVATIGVAQRTPGTGVSPLLILGVLGVASNFALVPAIDDARWMAVEAYNRANR